MKMRPRMSACRRWLKPTMVLFWPSATCSSAVRVNSWAPARQVLPASLKVASLSDMPLIEKARQQAQDLFARDPELQNPEYSLLAEALDPFLGQRQG